MNMVRLWDYQAFYHTQISFLRKIKSSSQLARGKMGRKHPQRNQGPRCEWRGLLTLTFLAKHLWSITGGYYQKGLFRIMRCVEAKPQAHLPFSLVLLGSLQEMKFSFPFLSFYGRGGDSQAVLREPSFTPCDTQPSVAWAQQWKKPAGRSTAGGIEGTIWCLESNSGSLWARHAVWAIS